MRDMKEKKLKNQNNTVNSEKERTEKIKALEAAIGHLEKEFGKGTVMKLGESQTKMNVEVVPTGSLSLDIALGLGGIPKGRIIEIYGPESSGKTTVALHMIAEVQKRGGIAGFVDAEHALDPVYAGNIGVDIDNLYISQPDSGEQALEIAETMVRSGAVDIIVVDSVAALTPQAEIDGDMGDSHVGLQARLMSQALRKLTATVSKTKCIVIFINQLREKIGVMFGNPETTTGGRALKFYASVRMDVRRTETLPASRSSRTRSLRLSRRPSSISCSAREFQNRGISSTLQWDQILSIRAAHGSPTTERRSGRAVRTQRTICRIILRSCMRWSRKSVLHTGFPLIWKRSLPEQMMRQLMSRGQTADRTRGS